MRRDIRDTVDNLTSRRNVQLSSLGGSIRSPTLPALAEREGTQPTTDDRGEDYG